MVQMMTHLNFLRLSQNILKPSEMSLLLLGEISMFRLTTPVIQNYIGIGVVTGGAAGALAPPLSDMGGQEYVCAPPLNVEQNHSYVEIILNHYNSSHFMANLFYFQQQLSKHFS